MTVLTELNHAGEFIVSEAPGSRSREAVKVLSGQDLEAGTVLGRVLAVDVAQVFTGTGNGVLTMDATTPLLAGVQEGKYSAVCLEPGANVGTFEVFDPDGVSLGKHIVAGTAFSNQIKFAIADGATDFVAGDRFDIYVGAGTASAVTGTGNGTITLYGTSEGSQPGAYALACTVAAANGGTFSVTAPDGTSLGTAAVGTRFTNGGLDFLINDGSTDFIVGDTFTITVTRGKVKAWNPANTDGSGKAFGVLFDAVDATLADTAGVAVVRDAEVNAAELKWFANATGAQKITGKTQLLELGIQSR